jgi:hypothetical protein
MQQLEGAVGHGRTLSTRGDTEDQGVPGVDCGGLKSRKLDAVIWRHGHTV